MGPANHWLDPKANSYKDKYPGRYWCTSLTDRNTMAGLLPGLLAAPRWWLSSKASAGTWAAFISIVPITGSQCLQEVQAQRKASAVILLPHISSLLLLLWGYWSEVPILTQKSGPLELWPSYDLNDFLCVLPAELKSAKSSSNPQRWTVSIYFFVLSFILFFSFILFKEYKSSEKMWKWREEQSQMCYGAVLSVTKKSDFPLQQQPLWLDLSLLPADFSIRCGWFVPHSICEPVMSSRIHEPLH